MICSGVMRRPKGRTMRILDNTEYRHVIISNSHIMWRGGPVIMQHVYFVNCTFDLPQANGQNLAVAILDNIAVDFKAT